MGLKPVGSEKLQGKDKIKRMIDIATYGLKKDPANTNAFEYIKEAKDGNTYVIIKEKDGYHIKTGLNESSLDYIGGIDNKNKNRFKSYSAALKRLNLMLKPINENFNDGKEDPVIAETKYVLKKDKPSDSGMSDMGDSSDNLDKDDLDLDLDLDLGDDSSDDLGTDDLDLDLGDDSSDDLDIDSDTEQVPEENRIKKIQKLTGKLGQELRDYKNEIESKDIKYVLNSILSAIDLTKLNEDDLEDVMENFEELENFEVEGGDMSDDLDLGDDSLDDLDLDLGDDEEDLSEYLDILDSIDLDDDDEDFEVFDRLNENKLSKTVNNILSKYYK